jgi:hypothetical protein
MVWRKKAHHRQVAAAPVWNAKVLAGIEPEAATASGVQMSGLRRQFQQDQNGRKAARSL